MKTNCKALAAICSANYTAALLLSTHTEVYREKHGCNRKQNAEKLRIAHVHHLSLVSQKARCSRASPLDYISIISYAAQGKQALKRHFPFHRRIQSGPRSSHTPRPKLEGIVILLCASFCKATVSSTMHREIHLFVGNAAGSMPVTPCRSPCGASSWAQCCSMRASPAPAR